VFSLIGLELPGLVRRLAAADVPWVVAAIAITATLLVVRVVWVLPTVYLAGRRSAPRGSVWRVTAVVAWAGTRGVVPLAAALSIPLTSESATPLAGRDLALVLAIAVIAISLVVQGFTLSGVVRHSGLALPGSQTGDEARAARERLEEYALSYLDDLLEQDAGDPALVARVRLQLHDRLEGRRRGAREEGRVEAYRQLWQDVVAIQTAELARMYAADQLSDAAYHQVQRQLDLEHARLADD